MNNRFGIVIITIVATAFFSSCNNDTATTKENKKDSSTAQSADTGKDKMSSMDNGLMTSMNAMMGKMKAVKMTGDFDVDFANMMIEHHQGAIDMSEREVSSGKDEKIIGMAQKIISAQKEEINKLKDLVKAYKPSGMKHGEGELQKSMMDMENKMKAKQMTGDMDKDFVVMMIDHHEGAVDMSKKELANGMSSSLKQMAKKTIDEQTREIKEFKAWTK